MELHRAFQQAHQEHTDILEFLNIWEEALQLAASEDCERRCTALRQLHAMEGKIVEIWEHCRKEEDDPGEPLFRLASVPDRERLKDEHFQLYRDNYEFRREMEFTTSSFTGDLIQKGERLLESLRAHIAFEEELLGQLAQEQVQTAMAAAQ